MMVGAGIVIAFITLGEFGGLTWLFLSLIFSPGVRHCPSSGRSALEVTSGVQSTRFFLIGFRVPLHTAH